MFVPIDDYLSRICNTLENVIAPDVESDFARGQVFATIALLSALGKKIEYKRELILGEINAGTDIISATIKVLKESGIEAPAEAISFMDEFRRNGPVVDTKYIDRVNGTFRAVLDCWYANRGRIKKEVLARIDKQIRDYVHDISLRDVGFMPDTTLDKILKSGKDAK
jgi:hypothetical protein